MAVWSWPRFYASKRTHPLGSLPNRQLSMTSRPRSFALLADQKWITCSLAFLKELEVISAKRTELANPTKGNDPFGEPSGGGPRPKAKGQPKKKGKGKGLQQAEVFLAPQQIIQRLMAETFFVYRNFSTSSTTSWLFCWRWPCSRM